MFFLISSGAPRYFGRVTLVGIIEKQLLLACREVSSQPCLKNLLPGWVKDVLISPDAQPASWPASLQQEPHPDFQHASFLALPRPDNFQSAGSQSASQGGLKSRPAGLG